nr:protein unc-93 homolog A-like [Ciona intestinalis]|eukprot:XP_026695647.1 protein unc-93 homolog A-like [Ciona intestinalis]
MSENKKIPIYVLTFGMTLALSAFLGTMDLQSSIHISHNLGTISLSILYGCGLLICLFVTPLLLCNLGVKRTLLLGEVGFLVFTLGNFYSGLATMIPGSIIGSMGESLFWPAGISYVNHVFNEYQDSIPDDQKPQDNVKNVWFGRYFGVAKTSVIWGNLLAYAVLYAARKVGTHSMHNTTLTEFNYNTCGSNFCKVSKNAKGNHAYNPKSKTSVYILLGVYAAMQLFALLLHFLCLPAVERTRDGKTETQLSVNTTKETLSSLGRHLCSTKQLLLAPMCFYFGFFVSYAFSDFTRAFVSCTMGVEKVGLVMAVYGVFNATMSFISTKASQNFGLATVICVIGVFDLSSYLVQLTFQPTSSSKYWVYAIAAMLGTSDGTWQPTISLTVALNFPVGTELAFGTITLWQISAMTIGFILSGRICLSIRIYLLIGNLVLACIGYTIVERQRRNAKITEETELLNGENDTRSR